MRPTPFHWLFVLLLAFAAPLQTAIAADPQNTDATSPIRAEPIPRHALDEMYRRQLGPLYNPAIADTLHNAHLLLEQFFATPNFTQRKEIIAQIAALNLDPNLIGRLTPIRLHWPQLPPGVYYINERVGPHPVIYFVGIPQAYDRTKPWPLVVRLPGAHPFVTDPPPTPQQVQGMYTFWVQQELQAHPDAVVLMPLLNLDELWGPSYKGMHSVMQPIFHVTRRVHIDPARVYLSGHAMSGHATWNLALHYPTFFAAINPMSAGASQFWQRLRLPNLRNVPAIVWHDAEDPIVDVEASRTIVKVLKEYGFDVDYEETQGIGHAPTPEVLERQYTKMRSRTRQLYPKQVSLSSNRPDSLFNRNDWIQVYQMLGPGREKKLAIAHGSGTITFQENSYDITATITAPNRIEVKARNIESVRFYLNDQMVDFSKPVTLVFNGVVRFQDIVKPSLEEMLYDQLYLGRGWRYYTGIIDIDFGALPPPRPSNRPTGKIEYTPPS